MNYIPRLKKEYKETVVSNLKKKFEYSNVMQVPRLEKIVISKGVGEAVNDKKLIDHAVEEITNISGQKAIATLSKKDVASFKLRKGMPVGVMVTLRGDKMYEFLDRLISATLPRVRDFKGVPKKGFDGRGNYTLGIKEHIVFQEIDLDKINKITGMDITIVTDTNSDEEAFTLLKEFGMPFSENGAAKKEAEEAEQKRQEAIKREAEEAARAEAAEEEEKKEADRRAALSQEERDKEDAEAKANEDTDSEENKDNNEESA